VLKYNENEWCFPTLYFMLSCLLRMIMSVYSHNYYRSLEDKKEILKYSVQQRRLPRSIPLYNKPYVTFTELFYRVRQKYLTILQNSCEWNRWRGEFVLECPSNETRSISVAMERWSVEHRAFAVETIFKNNDSVVVTQFIFRRHFNIHRNECP